MNGSTSTRLATALQELQLIYPDWRFGQLIANVAMWAKGPAAEAVWDVTDEELLHAAEEHLSKRRNDAAVVAR
jgi:hypothetical protein